IAQRVGYRQRRVRLDVALVHRGCGEAALDDDVRLGKALFDIAPAETDGADDVVRQAVDVDLFTALDRGMHLRLGPLPLLRLGADYRGVRLHRGARIDHDTERFVVDLDQRRGLLRSRLTLGDHHRDRLTVVDHLVAGEHGPRPLRWLRSVRQQVRTRDDVHHA